MSEEMTYAEKFASEFIRLADYSELILYEKDKKWTEITKEWIENILKNLSDNIITEKEYYRIDIIGWKQLKENLSVEGTNLKPHFWELLFAVEHENNSTELLDEICKLAYIRCPLRVVIGYDTNKFEEKCEIVKGLLAKTNAFTDNEQEFLLIIGPKTKEFKQGNNNFKYKIFKMESISFNLYLNP